MDSTRRGFLGILGAVTAAAAAAGTGVKGFKRIAVKATVFKADLPLSQDSELYVSRATVELKPHRQKMRQLVTVYCGPRSELNIDDDCIGKIVTPAGMGEVLRLVDRRTFVGTEGTWNVATPMAEVTKL